MAKKFEVPKVKIPIPNDRIPECIECMDRITAHVNGVMGSFEVASNEMLEEFHAKSEMSLRDTESRTDRTIREYFKRREAKDDAIISVYLEKQTENHKEYLKELTAQRNDYDDKKDKRENRSSSIMVAALITFAAVIGYLFDRQVEYQTRTDKQIERKANSDTLKSFLSIHNARELNDIRDSYYRQLFVITSPNKQTVDSTNYYWLIKHYLGDASRGVVPYKEAYDRQVQENNKN